MFYSADILSRRKEGLGLVCVVRKLTRRDFLSVDVTRVCRSVAEPPEPMALRLSSQLMFGIVRIFIHQSEMWMTDVANVHASLRKSISAIPTPPGKEKALLPSVDMRTPLASLGAITLPVDTAFYALDFDPTFLMDLPEPFALRAATPVGIADGFLPVTPPRPPRYVVPPERITLPAPVYEEEPGIARIGVPRGVEEGIEELEFPPVEIEEEEMPFDLGLEVGVEPEEFPEEAMPLAEPTSEAPEFFPELAPAEIAVPVPPEAPPLAIAPEVAVVAPPVPRARRPRAVRAIEDVETELTDEEMRDGRANYEAIMEEQRVVVQLRARQRQMERAAHNLIFGPPADFAAAPELLDLWRTTAGANLTAVDERFRAARRAAVAGPPPAVEVAPPVPRPMEEEISPPAAPPSEISFEEVARGLSPAELARRQAELPPWQALAERRREESISGLPPGMETVSEIAPGEFVVETPTGLRRVRVTPTRRPPSISFPSPGAPSTIEGFELGPPPPPSPLIPAAPPPPVLPPPEEYPHPDVVFQQDLEIETANFLEYAKVVRDELEDSFLFFSDLAPVASSSPSVAAQAFYHVLALTQSRRMRVKQDEPYGEIEIRIID
ncbi:uncharacterized protein PSFLO_00327 [Pseudozyma flocculosa]|uniref:Rad21/Rec8-like protein N-terminal domain-containing protein n=1 Tax=Pseudozyma flocculosa TaxID=84751 RepID=A0A5C3ETK2_9BASI|nr:uncharacterized protein PSFLO_00327 [Pseudozyma flocculosa]